MGIRLHYHTKHTIEYSNLESFNHCQEQVYNFLSKYDCQIFADNTEDCPEWASDFSVPRDEIETMLDRLNGYKNKNRTAFIADGERYTIQNMIDFFQDACDHAARGNSDIYFSWF